MVFSYGGEEYFPCNSA